MNQSSTTNASTRQLLKNFAFILLLLLPALLSAQGMWVPLHLEKVNEKEMRGMGLKLKADDIYSIAGSSIKDAICQFDGGCTGEMISPEGLLLTNHHCGFDAIQSHSTLEHNYVDNGFWAMKRGEELPCPGVTAMFVVSMDDVTALALQGVTEGMGERDRQSQIDKNIQQIRVSTKKEKGQEVSVRPFYNGNQYYRFITVTYRDVRLVGAPPSSIGKFGADTDNWVWPRHTGDFSLFRIYADTNNLPADYAPTNRPYQPKHFLPIALNGAPDGAFTMVYGFPGRTDEYLGAAAVRQTAEVLNPIKVAVRDRALKAMDGFMRQDADVKIAYIARYASIANAWKKWQGEMLGLNRFKAVEKKLEYEAEFTRRIQNNPDWNYRFSNLLPRIHQLHRDIEPYARARDLYNEAIVRNNELLGTAASLHAWIKSYDEKGEAAFAAKLPENKQKLEGFYKDYRPAVDQAVNTALLELYAREMPADWGGKLLQTRIEQAGGAPAFVGALFQNSLLPHRDKTLALLAKPTAEIVQTLKNDPAYLLWKDLNTAFSEPAQPKLQELQPQITLLQRQYMAAQMTVFKEKRFFPDANSTLRLTYGKINGYSPRDAVRHESRTYLDGVMEKYVPGDYEFDMPAKLIELWKNKDYGPYADAQGRMPVAFIATNHTTGGNSGSPALDARGNLIGLNFDRAWEGVMSDLHFEPAICRNIMVDIRYILFIIDKLGGARHLIEEMRVR